MKRSKSITRHKKCRQNVFCFVLFCLFVWLVGWIFLFVFFLRHHRILDIRICSSSLNVITQYCFVTVTFSLLIKTARYEVTPILEVLRPPQNLQNRRVCVLYAKTPKSEVLRPPQKLQNRRFCVVLKILVIIFNTPKSEVLRTIRKNSKNGGFAPTAKTPKSEVLRSVKNISNNI